jgi:long-chain acyl-CoA synthetase
MNGANTTRARPGAVASPDGSELTTLAALAESLAARGESTAVLAFQKKDADRWSYARLAGQIDQLARGLLAAGVTRDDHVAVFAGNRPEWMIAALAVIRAGAVVLPLDIQTGDKSLRHILNDSGARFVFTTREGAQRLDKLDLQRPPRAIRLDAGGDDDRGWRALLTDKRVELPLVKPEEPAALFYTSGTSGTPKGVPLKHRNIVFQLNVLQQAGVVEPGDRMFLPLPLHHVYPFVFGMLVPFAMGLTVVMPASLTGPQLARAIREGQATVLLGVPRLYRALVAGIQGKAESRGRLAAMMFHGMLNTCLFLRKRLGWRAGKTLLHSLHKKIGPRLRVMASGGSALDTELAWKLEAMGWQISIGYGLTETAPLLTLNPPGQARIGSAGKPIAGLDLKIDPSVHREEEEERRPSGNTDSRQGEILARGPNVFDGYRNLPDETKKAFTDDGWFRTGDLGYFDDDGYVYILGRVSTLIITEGGKNVQPEDVEEVYDEHPLIKEAGVLQHQNKLVALIVPEVNKIRRRGDGDGDVEQAIRDAVKEQSGKLPSYQRISDFAITSDPLPRTRLGKIRRRELEERYIRAREGKDKSAEEKGPMPLEKMSVEDRNLLDNEAAKIVWDWLGKRYAEHRLTPDTSPQLDLGIDSMEWLNITTEIGQRAGVELSEKVIAEVETVRDLLRAVVEASESGEEGKPQALALEKPDEALNEQQKQWLEPLGPVRSKLAGALFWTNRCLMRALFRVEAKGMDNLPDKRPFILAPNHVSYLDPLVVGATLTRRQASETYWAGWTGAAFANPITRFFSRLGQVVPIDPERAVHSSLAFCAAVLKREKNLVMFPEGQRSLDGKLQSFKPGIGLLLEHYDVPVVPVYIHGAHEALPPGKFLPRPRRITVTFGKPVRVRDLEPAGPDDKPHLRIAAALRDHLAQLVTDR